MLRVQRSPGALTVVSRLAGAHVLAVLGGALLAGALAGARVATALGVALVAAAALVVGLGSRATRSRFERGRVSVRHGVPLLRRERLLAEFAAARVETLGEARRRRAEARVHAWRERSGVDMPDWLRPPDAPGAHDHLRRVVLVGGRGERLAVTSWLADEDVEAARAEIEALLRGG